MDNSFFIYLEQLELMLFFSGYPLIYLLIITIAETGPVKKVFKKNISSFLPYGYAVVGILYLGFLLKSLYPDYSLSHINAVTVMPVLRIWGLLSICFFLPAIAKKPVYSLLHSLVFFFFICRDLYFYVFTTLDKSVLKNDMNIFTNSLLVNLVPFLFVLIITMLYNKMQRKKST